MVGVTTILPQDQLLGGPHLKSACEQKKRNCRVQSPIVVGFLPSKHDWYLKITWKGH